MNEYRHNPIPEPYYLRAGWFLDGSGCDARKDILMGISKGCIISLESLGHHDPSHEVSFDYSDATILPCLVDSHVHLCMSGTRDPTIRQKQLTLSAKEAEQVISNHLYDQFMRGVAAVRDGGDYAGHVLRYRDKFGSPENRLVLLRTAGRGWRASGRYGKLVAKTPLPGESLYDAILREEETADHIKIINSGLASLEDFGKEGPPQFDTNQLKDAVRLSDSLGLKTMVHANGSEPVRQSIEAGCHSIEHGFFMGRENVLKLAETRTTWVPTAFTMKACAENPLVSIKQRDIAMKNYEHQLGQIFLAARCGVTIAAGTDSGSNGVHHGEAMSCEVEALMDAGLSVETAVKCATLNGSVLLGLKDFPGSLKVGLPATFVVLRGDKTSLPHSLKIPRAIYVRGVRVFPCLSSADPGRASDL